MPAAVTGRSGKAKSHNPDMHAAEESDFGVVPMNQPNKGGKPRAEVGERRPKVKENIAQPNTRPTQSGASVPHGLSGVRQRAKERKQEKFTALLHHLTVSRLRESYFALKRKAAPGVDGETWHHYGVGLEDRLVDLVAKLKQIKQKLRRRLHAPPQSAAQDQLGSSRSLVRSLASTTARLTSLSY